MKIKFLGEYQMNKVQLIRRCSYGQIPTREISYARRLGRQDYPRFHIYIKDLDDGFEINLHLDQKKPSYKGSSAHSGEYDGELVEQEALRIKQIIDSLKYE